MEISKSFTFEASHILPKHPGKCSHLHGHSWKLTVYVKGSINPDTGFVMDYLDIKAAVQPVVDRLDHRHLGSWTHRLFDMSCLSKGDVVLGLSLDFYPTSENLILWIGTQIDDQGGKKFWSKLELNETCTSSCMLTREEYDNSVGSGRRNLEEKK